jgi:hypothetical protein
MLPYDGWQPIKPTPIDELRRAHPEQKRIDTESAALLRATALDVFRRMSPAAPGDSRPSSVTRTVR